MERWQFQKNEPRSLHSFFHWPNQERTNNDTITLQVELIFIFEKSQNQTKKIIWKNMTGHKSLSGIFTLVIFIDNGENEGHEMKGCIDKLRIRIPWRLKHTRQWKLWTKWAEVGFLWCLHLMFHLLLGLSWIHFLHSSMEPVMFQFLLVFSAGNAIRNI